MAVAELKKYAGIEKEEIKSYKVIKEKRATFVPNNETIDKRPNTKTKIKNHEKVQIKKRADNPARAKEIKVSCNLSACKGGQQP